MFSFDNRSKSSQRPKKNSQDLPKFYIHPQDFIYNVLGYQMGEKVSNVEERLEAFILAKLKKSYHMPKNQTNIRTVSVTRRSDIETWFTRYEVKSYLTRESILSALSQLEVYHHYGEKILGIFPKKSVIIGLAPIFSYDASYKALSQYRTSKNLIVDIKKMANKLYGIRDLEIIFINESKFFCQKSLFSGETLINMVISALSGILLLYVCIKFIL